MSWGERSCQNPCRSKNCTIETCNVDCPDYIWDQETSPDSKPSVKIEDAEWVKRFNDLELEFNSIKNKPSRILLYLKNEIVVKIERLLHKE
jgi:hypothetical protein